MNGNKLIQLLSALNKEEWIAYRKYLLMYTKEGSDNYKVFAYLQKRKHKLDDLPELETINVKHFPDLSTKSILNIMSRLYLWLEECLVFFSIKKDKVESDLILVKQLNRRGLYNLADQKAKQLQKQLDDQKGLSINKSRIQSELYYYQYYSDNPIKRNITNDIFPKLYKSTVQYQDELRKLIKIEWVNREKMFNLVYSNTTDVEYPSEIIKSLDLLLDSVENNNLSSFQFIKEDLLAGKFNSLSDIHIVITYYIQNLISRFYNLNNEIDPKEIHEVYNYAIESGVLLSNGTLTVVRFNNLVNSIAQISSINETSIFIDKWINRVDTKNTLALKELSKAKNQYFHKNYDLIPSTLLFHSYTEPEEKIIAMGFTLISLYEDERVDYDIAVSYCNNIKRFTYRNKSKLATNFQKSILNFIKILELLNKKRVKMININIIDYHPVFFKNWVLTKIKQADSIESA